MPAASMPADEEVRVATLRAQAILDTAPEAAFDRVVNLAVAHYNVPIALISLIDSHRQWFKAGLGMTVRETPRDAAFCAHAILDRDTVLMVPDATSDARFADNPLVRGAPYIRFYAGAPILAENGQPLGTLCIIDTQPRVMTDKDIEFLRDLAANVGSLLELHRKTLTLDAVATRDPLTNLANRSQFDIALAGAVDGALNGRPCGLIFLDLDGFKQINDSLGHGAGDAILQEVGRRLSVTVRGGDVVARLGGDEFAVIVDRSGSVETVVNVANRIRSALGAPHSLHGEPVPLLGSFGVALAPMHACSPQELMHAADQALYAAKRFGKDRVMVAGGVSAGLNADSPSLDAELRTAIAADALDIVWQPYVDLRTGEPTGYEALARWTRRAGGPVPPGIFVPVAEASDLIGILDQWVLVKACSQAVRWHDTRDVSVNLSAYWMTRGDLVGMVKGALAHSGLPPERLILELTERTMITNLDAASATMATLRASGVRFALDDFGVGFSSLNYLTRLPFDKVKIDRSFVSHLRSDRRTEAVAFAIIGLANALSIVVCAEGIETKEQLEFLTEAGCDLGQGYFLGHPKSREV